MADTEDSPEKAFNKGCMWGMSGADRDACPYEDDQRVASWEKGWQEGHAAFCKRHPDTQRTD